MAQGIVLTRSSSSTANVSTATGTLPLTNGGTGLTSIGGPNQVLGVNAAGTALEYKTLVAGSNVSISYAAGQITISSTGGSGGVSKIIAGTNVTISPSGGTGDVTINATGSTPYQLYNENPILPAANTVTGQNAVAIGEDNIASGPNTIALGITTTASGASATALGNNAVASHTGQVAFANGCFVTPGDAQGSEYIFRGKTTTQYPIEIFLDGAAQRLTLAANSAMTFSALAIARRTDVVGDYGAFRITGLIKQDIGTSSCVIIGQTSTEVITRTQTNLDLTLSADTVNGSLKVTVTGVAGQDYNWVVRVSTVEEIG